MDLLTISRLPFDSDAIDRARPVVIGDLQCSVVAPEDLNMKSVAHRPQDLQDIHAVIRANPHFDMRRVRTYVQEFARALDKSEIGRGHCVVVEKPCSLRADDAQGKESKEEVAESRMRLRRRKHPGSGASLIVLAITEGHKMAAGVVGTVGPASQRGRRANMTAMAGSSLFCDDGGYPAGHWLDPLPGLELSQLAAS